MSRSLSSLFLMGVLLTLSVGNPVHAQYLVSQFQNAGNPGGLNTEADATTTGWTAFMAGSAAANIWSDAQAIPFNFSYFGSPVTHFKASLNGLVTFDTTVTGTPPNNNTNLPSATLPLTTIACYWDEFTNAPPTGSNDVVHMKTFGTAPNRQFWIRWYSFEYGNPFISFAYFGVVLEESSNKIFLVDQYAAAAGLNTTAGLQLNGTTAIQFGDTTLALAGNGSANPDNDYLEFFPPLAIDMSVSGFLNVPGSVLPGSTVNFDVVVTNLGLNPVSGDTLNILKNGSTVMSTVYSALTSGEADTVSASITASGSGSDMITAALKTVSGDGNVLNDSLSTSVNIATLFTLPFFEHFDSTTIGSPGIIPPEWTNTTDDDFDWWAEASGVQNSTGTGPIADHTSGTGNYMYIESSSPNFPFLVAHLTTPFINLAGTTNPGAEFWFHMFGAAMGELHIDVWSGGVWTNDVRSPLIGQFQTAETDPWLRGGVDLTAFAGSTIKLRFRGISGSSFTSDMAIDDVRLNELDSLNFPYGIQARSLKSPLYTKIPLSQTGIASAVNFSATFSNAGPTNTGNLNVAVVDGTTAFSNSVSGVTLPAFRDSTVALGTWNATSATPDMYNVHMYSSGFTGINDTISSQLEIGKTLAYDNGNLTNNIAHTSTLDNRLGTRFTLTNADTLTSVTMAITTSTVATDSFAVDLYTSVSDTPNTPIARIYRGTFGDFAPLPAIAKFVIAGGMPMPAGDFYAILAMDTPSTGSFPLGADNTGPGAIASPRRFAATSGTSPWLFFENAGNAVFHTLTPIVRVGFRESGIVHDYAVRTVETKACLVVGQSGIVSSRVENVGNQPETGITVELLDNGTFVDDKFVSLIPGADTVLTFNYTPSATGMHKLLVRSHVGMDANPANDTLSAYTMALPAGTNIAFQDNFSDTTFTMSNWTVTNDGGDGLWMIYQVPYPNAYTLPLTSSGNVLSADADEEGSGTTTLTTATISGNLSGYQSVNLDFDSDWRILDAQDTARVKVSTNGGTTWTTVLEYAGVSSRNEHVSLDLTSTLAGAANASIAFQSIQPGFDWWWTIDNVCITGTAVPPPMYVQSFEGSFPPRNWTKLNPDGGTGWNRQANGTSPIPGWNGGIITVPPGGGNFVGFCTWTTGGPASNDQWLVTPRMMNIAAGDSISFWLRYWPNNYSDTLDLRISTTGNGDPSSFNVNMGTLGFGVASDTNWVRYSYRLSDFVSPGSNVYLGFREHVQDNLNNGASFSFDLFSTTASVDTSIPASKLLITEFVVTPTGGEFVEVYNPGASAVNLSNYYLTDATFAGDGSYYYNIVRGTLFGGGGFGDFHSRFPAGAMIGAGQYQTVALNGNGDFFTAYGVQPTYEIDQAEFAAGATDSIPNMLEVAPGSIYGADSTHNPGLTNGDEVIILYYWNGMSDLVGDVDYVLYNSGSPVPNDEAVDKSGVMIDGPDPDTLKSSYLNDVAVGAQMSAPSHSASGVSVHRIDMNEGAQISSGGNGVTGANEMSEDLNNTFTNNSFPSPNAPYVPIVGVEEDVTGIPDVFSLTQNFPNPFNPSTRIRFGVPEASSIKLTVHNILGQEIATLINGDRSAGSFSVEWNGRNQSGNEVASGVYFYRIEATPVSGALPFVSLRKMILLK